MEHIRIDQKKCIKDGACVKTCPIGLIQMEDKESFPRPKEGSEKVCINCGHCMAVCPTGALSLFGANPDEQPAISGEIHLTPEEVEELFKSRRSIRAYKPEPVSDQELDRIMDIARFAPTGHNAQLVSWVAAPTREKLEPLIDLVADWMRSECDNKTRLAEVLHLPGVVRAWEKGKDLICRGAPCLIATHSPVRGATPDTDAIIALAHADLAAHLLGLGACWAGYFTFAMQHHPPLAKAMRIPEQHQAAGALMIGRPVLPFYRVPKRKPLRLDRL